MTPATHNFVVWRGTAGPTQGLTVQLKTDNGSGLENIPYDDVRLSIYKRSTLILRAALSDGDGKLTESDPSEAEINWAPSAADTRLMPKTATYELEVWNGDDEVVYLTGTITGSGGINDDQTDGEAS